MSPCAYFSPIWGLIQMSFSTCLGLPMAWQSRHSCTWWQLAFKGEEAKLLALSKIRLRADMASPPSYSLSHGSHGPAQAQGGWRNNRPHFSVGVACPHREQNNKLPHCEVGFGSIFQCRELCGALLVSRGLFVKS